MNYSKIEKIAKELIAKREDFLNSQELVKACEQRSIPLSRKTIHNYVQDGLIPKPNHIGKEALFHKQYVLDELQAIYLLKSVFHVTYDDLKVIARNKHADSQTIVAMIHSMVSHAQANTFGKFRHRPTLVNMANDQSLQGVVKLFLEEIKKGVNVSKLDLEKFFFESMDRG